MKYKLYTLSFFIIIFSFVAKAGEEYAYRAVPVADQIADLMDDDRDGVINARDICPDTPLASDIDNDGCETYLDDEENWELKVLFEHDSSNISPAFIGEISSMVEFLNQYPETSIELQGHASVVGEPAYNQNLSEERALKVQDQLITSGITPDRVRIVGFGENVVVNKGDSPIDHAVNRRVVARVVGYDRDVIKEWTIFTKRKK